MYQNDEALLRRIRDRIAATQGTANTPSLVAIDRVLTAADAEKEAID